MTDRIRQALWLAESAHKNQENGNYFRNHIFPCFEIATREFYPLYNNENVDVAEDLIISVILHDTVEDTHLTTNDIFHHFGAVISSIVDFVTDIEGSRKERKAHMNQKFQEEKDTYIGDYAVYVKLIDRLQNIRRGGKREMYLKEHPEFKKSLYTEGHYEDIWAEIEKELS